VIKLLFAIICSDIIEQVCYVNVSFQTNSFTTAGSQYTPGATHIEHDHAGRLQRSGYRNKDYSLQAHSFFTPENLSLIISNQLQKLHFLTQWYDDPIISADTQCENNFLAQLSTIISPKSLFSKKTGFYAKNKGFDSGAELFADVKITGTRHDVEIIPGYQFLPKTDTNSVCLDMSMIEGNVNIEPRDFTICLVGETMLQGGNDYPSELRFRHESCISGDKGKSENDSKTIVF